MQSSIRIRGARLHNLKRVSLDIPKNKLVVITGVSGSGKSTLALDTLHQEGQRQYMESLGMVSEWLSRPPLDSIEGLSPSISVDQHNANRSPRSTVGTVTEVFTYLRVLFARVGRQVCPQCGAVVEPDFLPSASDLEEDEADQEFRECPGCGGGIPRLTMAHFSFNKPAGACSACTGLGVRAQANVEQLVDFSKPLHEGAVHGWDAFLATRYLESLRQAARHYDLPFRADAPVQEFSEPMRDLFLYGVDHPLFLRHVGSKKPPATVGGGKFEGVVTNLMRRYNDHLQDPAYREKMSRFFSERTCEECRGTRLSAHSRSVTVAGHTIIDASGWSLNRLSEWQAELSLQLPAESLPVIKPILDSLDSRIRRLLDVGVGYLSLGRATPSLSAGEAQRLRLASLLGSGLTGVLYVLDEPTIGLHPSDTGRLIRSLRRLRDLENTVLVIEHDLDMLRAADFLVDVGPGAGRAGGQIVAQGTPDEVAAVADSATGRYLAGMERVSSARDRGRGEKALIIRGARAHNLKDVDVRLPLERLVALSGASGSGKSTLLFDIVDRAAQRRFQRGREAPGDHDSITGWEHIHRVISVDQMEIGHSTRSNVATYTDTYTPIREMFAALPEARKSNLTPRFFSFNVPGGRCERCEGAGVLTIAMQLLPDSYVRCPACHGRRFKPEVLAVTFEDVDIARALDMTVEEAAARFSGVPDVHAKLSVLAEVGLGYIQLGQSTSTLSGGEAQRVKLAKELGRGGAERTLYLLDEPSTGLHPADIAHLTALLHRLVDAGNSVIFIEHNPALIASADWVIDLGPEGGEGGGYILAEGTPGELSANPLSCTGPYLAQG